MVHGDMETAYPPDNDDNDAEDIILLAHTSKTALTSPGDLKCVLFNSMARNNGKKPPTKPPSNDGEITINGKKYRQVSMAKMMYFVSFYHG